MQLAQRFHVSEIGYLQVALCVNCREPFSLQVPRCLAGPLHFDLHQRSVVRSYVEEPAKSVRSERSQYVSGLLKLNSGNYPLRPSYDSVWLQIEFEIAVLLLLDCENYLVEIDVVQPHGLVRARGCDNIPGAVPVEAPHLDVWKRLECSDFHLVLYVEQLTSSVARTRCQN